LIDRLEEIEPGPLWEDAKAGTIRHRSALERTAMVTDQEWLVRAARLMGWMAPGEFKVFPTAELEHAKAWISG
jgi:SpoIIAA-like